MMTDMTTTTTTAEVVDVLTSIDNHIRANLRNLMATRTELKAPTTSVYMRKVTERRLRDAMEQRWKTA